MTVNQVHGATARAADGGDSSWHWPVPRDPGDLSRRLAARRAELKLSQSQVAHEGAGLSRVTWRTWRTSRASRVPPRCACWLRRCAPRPRPCALGAGQEVPPGRDPGQACWGAAGVG